jgi:4-hydroxy-3-methylbut-2-enyl diphosphate reductase
MKQFEIPNAFKSDLISDIKSERKSEDPRKKDFSPTKLVRGNITFYLARHFGFCYGVENAIEISYKALRENQGRPIYLLSQMIHNPIVNQDLEENGIRFIQDTYGKQLMNWDDVEKDAVVIIPAFGTTVEIEKYLQKRGIETAAYNTTCPFVEKVWKVSKKLGEQDYTIIIHGKHQHEETRATFSHAKESSPSVVVKDLAEAQLLGEMMEGKRPLDQFNDLFEGKCSKGFDPEKDLYKVGVVNQTTMLAEDTQEIADYFKDIMQAKFKGDETKTHFADTRDTLCYATNDNQNATKGLLEIDADIALVVGGYNSSNTSHLVELLEGKFPTYYISSVEEIKSKNEIHHFNWRTKENLITKNWYPEKSQPKIIVTSGASCPDSEVEKVLDWFNTNS